MAKTTVSRFASLDAARAHYLTEVDRQAEQARGRYITPGDGQAMTYSAKYQEALRYPNSPPFPWLEAEAEALGMTAQEVADSVIAARAEWERVGAAIEAARLKAKAAVRAAVTPAEMHRTTRSFTDQI